MSSGIVPVVEQPKQKKNWKWWLRIVLIFLLVIFVLSGASMMGGYVYLLENLPQTQGEIRLPGLQALVQVYRDAQGVPHIEATNLHDLFKVQGYVTAQERLFQMDLSRRQASGQLSEVIGKVTLDRDRFFRTFGLRRAAEESLAQYPKEYQQILNDYAEGVNAYIAQAKQEDMLPVEFSILGYEPTPWNAIDSLAIGKYMAYDLGGRWEGQAFRYYLTQKFSKEKAMDLFPSYPKNAPDVIEEVKHHPLDVANSFAEAVLPHDFNGSNNWVVAGSKSSSGKPLLADDPHLGLGTPAIWFETHLKAPDFEVSGVVFAGIPGIVVGHNKQIAWGVTNVGPDVQDLYIEKRNPNNPNQFLYQGKWEDAKLIKEVIKVKGEKDVIQTVQVTRHGPIISEFAHDKKPDTALSLKWTALEPTTELQAVLLFAKAKNWDDFKEALTYFHVPAQNFVFASTDGTIAYRANGRIPIRKQGDGTLPMPGWTDEYEWTGYIPWDQLPTLENPETGWIATANNRVVDDSYPYHITHTWAQPYRQQRIVEVLSSKSVFTPQDLQKLQFDHQNLQAREFVPLFLKILNSPDAKLRPIDQKAKKLFETWNYEDHKDLTAPLLFHLLMEQIPKTLFDKQIDPKMMKLFDGKAQVVDQLIRRAAEGNTGPWIQEKGGLDQVIIQSFQKAVDRATELQGDEPTDWSWGAFHQVTFSHPLASVPPLDLIFNPSPTPVGGSRVTVGAAGWKEQTGEVDHGAAWRTVIDLARPTESLNVVGPGQSGHVVSQWYQNQIQDWTTGGLHLTSMEPSVYQKTVHHLTFKP